jgi:hypothetical protein
MVLLNQFGCVDGHRVSKSRIDGIHSPKTFSHSLPIKLETISMIDNMSELAERGESGSQFIVEKNREWNIGWGAKPLEDIYMPGVANWQRDLMIPMNALEDVSMPPRTGQEMLSLPSFPLR